MNLLLHWYPGDAVIEFAGRLIVEISAVFGVVAILTFVAARRRPAARHALWLAALLTVALAPLTQAGLERAGWRWSIGRPVGLDQESPISVPMKAPIVADLTPPARQMSSDRTSDIDDSPDVADSMVSKAFSATQARIVAVSTLRSPADVWRSLASLGTVIWLAGAAFLLVRLLRGDRQVRQLLSDVQPVAPGCIDESIAIATGALGVVKLPPIVTSSAVAGPVVAGLTRPTVVLPADFVTRTGASQLADVIVHECAHALRSDVWVGLAQRLVQLAFWPHPLIYFLNCSLSRAREEVCDNYVLRRGDAVGYAQTLLELAEHYNERPVPTATLAIFSPRWKLEDRVAGLVNPQRNHETRVGRTKFLAIAALLVAGGSALAAGRFDDPDLKERLSTHGPATITTDAALVRMKDQATDSKTVEKQVVMSSAESDAAKLDLDAVLEAYEKGAALIQSYDITYHADRIPLLIEQSNQAERAGRRELQRLGNVQNPRGPSPVRYVPAGPDQKGRTLHSRQYFNDGRFRIECFSGSSGQFEPGECLCAWNGATLKSFNAKNSNGRIESYAGNHAFMGDEVPPYEIFYRTAFGDYPYANFVRDRDSTWELKDGLYEIDAQPAPAKPVNLNALGLKLALDSRANFLPRRLVLTSSQNGRVIEQTKIENKLEEVRPGVWLPTEVTISALIAAPDVPEFGKPHSLVNLAIDKKISRFNEPVADQLFDLDFPPRTSVADGRSDAPGRIQWQPVLSVDAGLSGGANPIAYQWKLWFAAHLKTRNSLGTASSMCFVEVDLKTGRSRKMPLRVFTDFQLSISPDGRSLVHVSPSRGLTVFDVARPILNRQMPPGFEGFVHPSWTPDGQNIVISKVSAADDGRITFSTWQVNANGQEQVQLPIPNTDCAEDLSRDGKWLVTRTNRHTPDKPADQLYVMKFDGTEGRPLTKDGRNENARIAPDGRRVVYVREARNSSQLRMVNIDGTGEQTILADTDGKNAVETVAWSPDGKHLAVVRFDWTVGKDGQWSRDTMGGSGFRIEFMDADGGNRSVMELEGEQFLAVSGLDWR